MATSPNRHELGFPLPEQCAIYQSPAILEEASDTSGRNQNSNVSSGRTDSSRSSDRVARACDECRGRKIKCDGRQVCLHCTLLNQDCTYDRPSKRSKRLSQKDIEALESKLLRAQSLLKAILPDLDLDDPNIEADVLTRFRASTPATQELAHTGSVDVIPDRENLEHDRTEENDSLETILEVTGQVDLDGQGNWSYDAPGSSSAFMRRLGERFGNVAGSGLGKDTVLRLRAMPISDEPLRPFEGQSLESLPDDFVPLPPKDIAQDLSSSALGEACALLTFIHQPSFYYMFNRLYQVETQQYGAEEWKFLPLLYAVFAVGSLFSKSERVDFGHAYAVSEGEKYFVASRKFLAITECRDLCSIQALLFIIIFLQSSAKMTTCHSYINAAMAASIQMGLHRCDLGVFNPIERETRKRIFWTVRTMETYIVAILGFPRTVGDENIDQEMPSEIDDQFITDNGLLPMPDGQISIIAGFNAHIKLVEVLAKVITNVYPITRLQKDTAGKPRAYKVCDARVREVEECLQHWARDLQMQLRPGGDSSEKFLRYTFWADWFSTYTTFCATLALGFYIWENADAEGVLQTLKDAEYGRDLLMKLSHKSMSAARHSEALATIFTCLPKRLGRIRQNQAKSGRKRHIPLHPEHNEQETTHDIYETLEASFNLDGNPQQVRHPANSGPFRRETVGTGIHETPQLQRSFGRPGLSSIPPTSDSSNSRRYLGPDCIEDLFNTNILGSGDVEIPIPELTARETPLNLESLDHYVSTLDLQNEQQSRGDVPNSISDRNSLQDTRLDYGAHDIIGFQPFIPMSPYSLHMSTPGSCPLAPPSSYTFHADYYSKADQSCDPELGSQEDDGELYY